MHDQNQKQLHRDAPVRPRDATGRRLPLVVRVDEVVWSLREMLIRLAGRDSGLNHAI